MISIPFAGAVNDLRNASISNFTSRRTRVLYVTKNFHTCQLKLKKVYNNSSGAIFLKIKESLFYFLQRNKENNC